MPYPEDMIKPMRDEATDMGCEELRSGADAKAALAKPGTALVFINSVCGCAAAMARPGLRLALEHAEAKPDHVYTAFAGNDVDAVAVARDAFVGYRPSSPAMGLLRDGELVAMIERHDIEGHSAQEVAMTLITAFNEHCRTAQA